MVFKISTFLRKPYPLNINFFKNLPVVTGFSVFVTLFLILYQPMGLNRFQHPNKTTILIGVGIICFLGLSTQILTIPRILRKAFSEESWSVGREVMWEAWLCLSTIFVLAVYWSIITGTQLTARYLLIYTVNSVLFTAFFLPSCIMLNYIRLIKKKLKTAEALSQRLQSSKNLANAPEIELRSENGTDKVQVSTGNLLFIQSQDNYANIVKCDNGKTEETLLRSSLKNLEQQLSAPFVIRCHRSFIVNLTQVRSVMGNARHYTLIFKNHAQLIPVSRESEKQILRLLEDLNQP
jgi:hypothetical protein